MDAEALLHYARPNLVEQRKHVVFGDRNHVRIFHRGHRLSKLGDLLEVGGEQGEAFRLFGQMPVRKKIKNNWVKADGADTYSAIDQAIPQPS